jgi:RNA polymerase sigma-70 factor (ECF subfamily)
MVTSDEALLELIAANDREALGCLFRRYAKVVHSVGRRILRDEAEAEDLVQDVFLYINRKSAVYDPAKGNAGSWIIQTAYYQALQRRMRLMKSQYHLPVEIAEVRMTTIAASTGSNHGCSNEVLIGRTKWREILKTLTGNQWETLRMHFFEGYTLSEIAQKRGESVGNTRHHFYRGLEALRKHVFSGELNRRATNNGK